MAVKRVLALLVAAGLIVAALQVRDRGEAPSVGPDGAPTPGAPGDAPASDGGHGLVCISELSDVCGAVASALAEEGWTVEPSVVDVATYLDAITTVDGPPVDPAVWLAVDPLPALAAQRVAAAGGGAVVGSPVRLARSPLVAAVWEDRAAVLEEACGGVLHWRCIGDATGGEGTWAALGGPAAWGLVKPGHEDPTASAEGLLVLGQLAAGYFDRADISTRDLDDPGFFGWFTDLQRAVPSTRPSSGSALRTMVTLGPASYDVVGVAEAQAVGLLARSAERAGTLTLRAVEPVATADAVAVAVGQDPALEELMGAVAGIAPAELARAGWRVPDQPASDALSQAGVADIVLPDDANLPSAGALEALRRMWSEVAR